MGGVAEALAVGQYWGLEPVSLPEVLERGLALPVNGWLGHW